MKVTFIYITMLSQFTYLISDITAQSCSAAQLSVCSCSGTTVNCNNVGLTSVPANIPASTTILELKFNNITTIDDSSFAGLSSLTRLLLDGNHVSSITTNAFRDLTSLNTISLSSNYLTSLNNGLFATNTVMKIFTMKNNNFATLSEQVFPQITGILFIDLSDNPFICCTISSFLEWAGNMTGLTLNLNCVDNLPAVSHQVFDSSNCSAAVNGHWGDWTNSSCSVTCGDGTIIRQRICDNPAPSNGGLYCVGESSETISCSKDPCVVPVNGEWGDWTNSSCSVTCGDGTITRQRVCNNPAPSNGGLNCVGESSETISCSNDPCVETESTSNTSELTPLIIGLVVGVTFVTGILALVTIILVKYTSPRVSDINLNNNNDIRKIKA